MASGVSALLRQWDKGNKQEREALLTGFNAKYKGKTGPEIELDMNNGASLFLIRVSTYLKLLHSTNNFKNTSKVLPPVLTCLSIFILASSGQKFLAEFVSSGCIATLLALIGHHSILETDKHIALQILVSISNGGRAYKELLCENNTVKVILDSLWMEDSTTLELCRSLIYNIAMGNPKHSMEIQQQLLQTLKVQKESKDTILHIAGQCLRLIMSESPQLHRSFINPIFHLLLSNNIHVQYEGFELLKMFSSANTTFAEDVITTAIHLLLPLDLFDENDIHAKERKNAIKGSLAVATAKQTSGDNTNNNVSSIQQGAAARLLGILCEFSQDLSVIVVRHDGIAALLLAMANTKNQEAQKNAGTTLAIIIRQLAAVEEAIQKHFGEHFYDHYIAQPDEFYQDLHREWLKILKTSLPPITNIQTELDHKRRKVVNQIIIDTRNMVITQSSLLEAVNNNNNNNNNIGLEIQGTANESYSPFPQTPLRKDKGNHDAGDDSGGSSNLSSAGLSPFQQKVQQYRSIK